MAYAGLAVASENEWEVAMTEPISIKNRSLPKSLVKEVWAEGEMAAPAIDIQEALTNIDRLHQFMPFLKEARQLGTALSDGSIFVYTMIDLPIVGKRDYIVRRWLRESIASDGTGRFRNEWKSYPTHLPKRPGVIRVVNNSGGWLVTPIADGAKSWVVYKFTADPGGWIPTFAVNLGNQKGVGDTYQAVEKEAQRLRAIRIAASKVDRSE